MEVFIRKINFGLSERQLEAALAAILHEPPYTSAGDQRLNFRLYLHRDKRGGRPHGGTGTLTLPSKDIGEMFLQEFSLYPPRRFIELLPFGMSTMFFQLSGNAPRDDIVQDINRLPYLDPSAIQKLEKREAYLLENRVRVHTVQFGWECIDESFSIEWEHAPLDCKISLNEERRELRVSLPYSYSDDTGTWHTEIATRYTQIRRVNGHHAQSNTAVLCFQFWQPPSYELVAANNSSSLRRRFDSIPFGDHKRVSPYASYAMRLVLPSTSDLLKFREISSEEHGDIKHHIQATSIHATRRSLFSAEGISALNEWTRRLSWSVAFQVESLVCGVTLTVVDMLDLKPKVDSVVRQYGSSYASKLLKHFHSRIQLWNGASVDDDEYGDISSVTELFDHVSKHFSDDKLGTVLVDAVSGTSTFESYHLWVTPTMMFLEGPFPEQSNRIIRSFGPQEHESFLRVSFVDEGRLQYRVEREVDAQEFLRRRVGSFLKNGIYLAGRLFHFLAYSQSALKEHSVWFVKPFLDGRTGQRISAETIISSIGRFDDATMFCPARYAARISQAFTATDASVPVEVEEIIPDVPDIETVDRKYSFTDGVGTISLELCKEIWQKLRESRKRARRSKGFPRAFQIRFQGSKGMLSVDYRLQGRPICLRKSMTKFQAPESNVIEVARAFDRPTKYFLNRPLIMLLEGLGINYDVFKHFQDMAISEVDKIYDSLERCGRIMETYGLGGSYRLTSVMLELEKLGIDYMPIQEDDFHRRMIEFARNHVLRELKNHARIPIPGAWTLVGVCDVHKELQENEIFACIRPHNTNQTTYLEGSCLISRSPTIHPGDVQIVHAIGNPSVASCFSRESLPNTVVFSVKGDRPVPSMLGGGDLDGDVYNIIPLNDPNLRGFKPTTLYEPALYEPAQKLELDRPATMTDVADFVVDFLTSDVVGIIAINWLIIADLSSILDPDCLALSQLHSEAVDYPKSGRPVRQDRIPRLKSKAKPDWNAPETVNISDAKYYPSNRAIGRLFRAVDLPAVDIQPRISRYERKQAGQPKKVRRRRNRDLMEMMAGLSLEDELDDNPTFLAVHTRVNEFIDTDANFSAERVTFVSGVFERYVSELQVICASNTMTVSRSAFLTEEEAIVGTIVQKTSQPRKRKELMSKVREQTDNLVRRVREELSGQDNQKKELFLEVENGWLGWLFSMAQERKNRFGARSFWWICLGVIFGAVKDLEEVLNDDSRSRR